MHGASYFDNNSDNVSIFVASPWNESSSKHVQVQQHISADEFGETVISLQQTDYSNVPYDRIFNANKCILKNHGATASLSNQQSTHQIGLQPHVLPLDDPEISTPYLGHVSESLHKSRICDLDMSAASKINVKHLPSEHKKSSKHPITEPKTVSQPLANQVFTSFGIKARSDSCTPISSSLQSKQTPTFSKEEPRILMSPNVAVSGEKLRKQGHHKGLSTPNTSQSISTSLPPPDICPLIYGETQTGHATCSNHILRNRACRSAVEEARIHAQHQAAFFAGKRKETGVYDKPNVDSAMVQSSSKCDQDACFSEKEKDCQQEQVFNTQTRAGTAREKYEEGSYGKQRRKTKMNDKEGKRTLQYQRRLDMNRKSAAVSRVRRRAYVKELEERLAVVEAEKFQLEGKLEIMISQNESYKRRLDKLLLMVLNGTQNAYPDGLDELNINQLPNNCVTSNVFGVDARDGEVQTGPSTISPCSMKPFQFQKAMYK